MPTLGICQKVEKTKQLHFGIFNQGFHGLIGATFHSTIDLRDSRF
jgi:hypothetical protein